LRRRNDPGIEPEPPVGSGQPPPVATAPPAAPPAELTLIDLLGVLRRYTLLLAGCLGIGMGLAIATLAWLNPVYVATAQLLIEPTRDATDDGILATAAIADDNAAILSQVTYLASRSMARSVIETLELDLEPELRRILDPTERLAAGLGIGRAVAEGEASASLVDRFLERLNVDREGQTHVIRVSFKSSNPLTAARIANGIAERYIDGRLDAKAALAGGANAWLEQALAESRRALEEAEAELAAYRSSAQSAHGAALAVDSFGINSLRRDVAAAAADRAASEARLRRVRSVLARPDSDLAFEELGGSAVLENLYAQKNQTTRREAELATLYGDRHPQIVNIRAERREIERRIHAEQAALVGTVEAQIQAARAREDALVRELDALKSQSLAQSETEAGIARLERAVERARQLHESYVARQQSVADVVGVQRPDVRLISEATPPVRPSFPKPALFFGLFSMASLGTGLLMVFFLEQLDRGFRTQRAAENGLGRRCIGCLPLVPSGRRSDVRLVDLPLDSPCSRFAEALRQLVAELSLAPATSGGRVVLLTSAVPGEGKSTTSLALARLAASEGQRVLLIDADLRRPRLAELLDLDAPQGLVEILKGEREAEEVLLEDPATGLALVPGSARVSQPTRLLGPHALGVLLAEARRHFDLVLIDSPPVLAVTDARVMASLCDGILFLVRWQGTQRAVAAHALDQLGGVADKVLGTVLTMADPDVAAPLGAAESRLVRRQLSRYYSDA
jgi:capsular exopolysaccharide synthesis family protein